MTSIVSMGLFLGSCSEDKKGPEIIPSTINMYGKDYNLQSGVIWKNNRNVVISREDYTYEETYINEDGQEVTDQIKGFAAGKDVKVTGNFMLSLYGTGLTFNSGQGKMEGQGACVCFHLNSLDIDKIVPGKYVYRKEKQSNTFIGYSSVSWGLQNQGTPLEITGGEVTVEQKENTYTVKFDCKTANGNSVKGQYEGVLQVQRVEQAAYGMYEDVTIAGLLDTVFVNMTLGGEPVIVDEPAPDFDNGAAFYSTTTNTSRLAKDPDKEKIDITLLWDQNTESFMFESPIRTYDYLWHDKDYTFPCHTTYMRAPESFKDEDFAKLEETGFSYDIKDEKIIIPTKEFQTGYVFFQTGNGIQGVIHIKKFTSLGTIETDVIPDLPGMQVIITPKNATLTMDIKCPVSFVNPPIR